MQVFGFDNARRIEYAAPVGGRFLIRALFTVLALQLALGLEVDVAHAMPQGMHTTTSHVSAHREECPLHSAAAAHAAHFQTPHDWPGKHDCCKSACQCQCGNLSLAFDLSLVRVLPVTAYVQPAPVSRVANAPADTHFRPPIAA